MKTITEVLVLINNKTKFHQNEIYKIIEELKILRNGNIQQTDAMKLQLMKYTMTVAEHKGIINSLQELLKEINDG
jgi:UTP-glucose-1-phosphate uridylyltransferase